MQLLLVIGKEEEGGLHMKRWVLAFLYTLSKPQGGAGTKRYGVDFFVRGCENKNVKLID